MNYADVSGSPISMSRCSGALAPHRPPCALVDELPAMRPVWPDVIRRRDHGFVEGFAANQALLETVEVFHDRDVEDPELLVKLLQLVDDILRALLLDLSVHGLHLLGRESDCVPASPVLPDRRAVRLIEQERNLVLVEGNGRTLRRVDCLHPELPALLKRLFDVRNRDAELHQSI